MTEDCFAPAIGHAPAFKTAASVTTVPEAERVFSEWFGAPVVLTSSGRTAISLYLGVTGHERYRHSVAVPRMISACVLDAVIRRAFPVDAARQQAADTTLLYHQYGFMQSARPQGRVLEDISHSFFASASTGARPWAGDAAVFSLQKFFPLATMVGGLVVRDVDLARTVRDARDAYVEPDANRRREHGAVLAAVPGRERKSRGRLSRTIAQSSPSRRRIGRHPAFRGRDPHRGCAARGDSGGNPRHRAVRRLSKGLVVLARQHASLRLAGVWRS